MKQHNLYTRHFGLTAPPFGLSPQPDFFYGGAKRENALRQLIHFVEEGEGVALITGEVGAGKTMLLTMLLRHAREYHHESIIPILINRLMLSTADLVHTLAEQLQVETSYSNAYLQSHIETRLLQLFAEGKRTLVIVDEAHSLSNQSLEWLRQLTNLETAQGKLLQLLLFAQPEILSRFGTSALRALADRLTLKIVLADMNRQETDRYLNHRLHAAGYRGDGLFSEKAIRLISKYSGGLSRKIHVLADQSLLAAYAESVTQVQPSHVRRAIDEVYTRHNFIHKLNGWLRSPNGTSWLLTIAGLLFAVAGYWLWIPPSTSTPTTSTSLTHNHNATSPELSSPKWHSGIRWFWTEKGNALSALLPNEKNGLETLAQSLAKEHYFLRLISKSASEAEAKRWMIALQQQIEYAWGNIPKTEGKPVTLIAYYFHDGKRRIFRLIATGYTSKKTAENARRDWQMIFRQGIPAGSFEARPIHSLLDTHE